MSASTQYEVIASNSARTAAEVTKILERVTYGGIDESRYNELKIGIDKTLSNSLYNKKFGMLGDSYVNYENDDGAPHAYQVVAIRNSMQYFDYGKSGNTVARVANTTNWNYSQAMCVRYVDMINDLDYVGFEGGTNDQSIGVPVGELTDTSESTFCGALNILCEGLLKKYVGKKIFGVSRFNVNDASLIFIDAFESVCQRWSIPCLSGRRNEVYMRIPEFRAKFSNTAGDVSHFNKLGHEYFAERLESFMLAL